MKVKKIILSIIAILIIVSSLYIIVNGKNYRYEASNKINIVSSNFASYDFLRAIIGENDNIKLTFLVGPGKDAHGFEPTAKDLITIQNADLFVYVGGEMEQWTDKVLGSIEDGENDNTLDENTEKIIKNIMTANRNSIKTICISKFVETIEEQEIDGAEDEQTYEIEKADNNHITTQNIPDDSQKEIHEHEEGAFDEHIWTSPDNAIKMIQTLEKAMEEIDIQNARTYKINAQNYIEEIQEVDEQIQEIVDNRVRDRLVFADRMPMQYFVNYYDLEVTAAFSGCSTDIEPSATTIAYLENKVKGENIPVILHIELNDGTVAKTIAEGTGANVKQIQTLHNISLKDFNNGETWVSLMKRNIEVLKNALL